MTQIRPYVLLILGLSLVHTCGCPRPADDQYEPNDTPETATTLTPGEPIEARVVQDTTDVFSITAAGGTRITFHLEARAGEDCVDFRVLGPDGNTLYDDGRLRHQCGSERDPVAQALGVELIQLPDRGGYRLTIPIVTSGEYLLTLRELGYADNIPTYAWDYRLTAAIE